MVNEMYQITKDFPKEESYGLTSQIKRSAVSVPSNIAEGAARNSNKEYIHFLYIALGSLMELDTQLLISYNLQYIKKQKLDRKSTRLNSSHVAISYAVFCLKKKKQRRTTTQTS